MMQPKGRVEAAYALSALQEGILFHTLQEDVEDKYIVQVSCRFPQLDVVRWQNAWSCVCRRHEVLRTAFAWQKTQKPLQLVLSDAPVPCTYLDWSALPEGADAERFAELLEDDRRQRFNLAAAPLMRMTVLCVRGGFRFLWSYHHLILDAWSAAIVMSEVLAVYQGAQRLVSAPRFASYLEHRARSDPRRARAFWASCLKGLAVPPRLQIPIQAGAGTGRLKSVTIPFAAEFSAALTTFLKSERCTLAHLVQATWAVILYRFCESEDVVLGAVISDRPADMPQVEQTVGLMVNTVPLRVRVSALETARALLAQVAAASLDVAEHAHLPLTEIHSLAGTAPGSSLFQTLVVIENLPGAIPQRGRDLEVLERMAHWRTSYPLSLMAAFDSQLRMQIAYDDQQLEVETVNAIARDVSSIMLGIVRDSSRTIGDLISGLDDDGQMAGEATPVPQQPLWESLQSSLSRRGVVIECADEERGSLTGPQLCEWTEQIAAALGSAGVGQGDVVALQLGRTPALVAAILASMKLRAIFLPIDPDLPQSRREFMICDSRARALLVDTGPQLQHCDRHVQLDHTCSLGIRALEVPAASLQWQPGADAAYILYTSGSSGRPKGVVIREQSLRNLLDSMAVTPGLAPGARLLATTTISFDICLLELLLPLYCEATLVLAPQGLLKDPQRLAAVLRSRHITVMQATPTTWRMLIECGWQGAAAFRIWSGGEALPRELADALLERGCEVWNLYGPTETTIWSMCSRVQRSGDPVDLGRPVRNTRVRLVDRHGLPAPVQVPAELFIGGVGVARGYVGGDHSDAFVQLSDDPRDVWYRTGDIVRRDTRGRYVYVGRRDAQIKLRGVRIELPEIEEVLREHPAVAVAAARVCMIGSTPEIVAYVVEREPVADAEILANAARLLPASSLPRHIVRLNAMPLTFNGKLDRTALPDPQPGTSSAQSEEGAASVAEQVVMRVWSDVLGLTSIGLHDNFFALGGHSLKVVTAIAAINRAFNIVMPLASLFDAPTPQAFARALRARLAGAAGAIVQPPLTTQRGVAQPLSSTQLRLWYVTRMDTEQRPYVLAAAARLKGNIDADRLTAAFDALQRRHSVLRTVFVEEAGLPRQQVQEEPVQRLQLIESGDAHIDEQCLNAEIRSQVAVPLPLLGSVPLRAMLIRRTSHEAVLLLMIHHILVDEWSLALLVDDLGKLYAGTAPQRSPDLPILAEFIDYAAAEHHRKTEDHFGAQIAYWREKLAGAPLTTLPPMRARPAVLQFQGGHHSTAYSRTLLNGITRLAHARATTPFVALLTALFGLLTRYLAHSDLCIGIMDACRDDPSVQDLVGPLARPLAVRMEFDAESSFETQLQRMHRTVIEAWIHREAPFEQIVSAAGSVRRSNINPLFQIMVVMQNLRTFSPAFGDLQVEALPVDTQIAEFDMLIEMFERPDGLTLRFSFNANLYLASEIEAFARRFESVLWAVVEDPAVSLSAIDLMGPAAQAQS